MQEKHKSAIISLILANLIWAGAVSIIKLTVNNLPPFEFLFIRLLIVCLIVLPHTIYLLKKETVNIKDYLNIFLLGMFSQSSLAFIFWGLKYTTAIDTTFIGIITSISTIYIGHYLYKEKTGFGIRLGVLLAILGTFIIFFSPALETTDNKYRLLGNTLVLIYNLFMICHILWSKTINAKEAIGKLKKLRFIKPMSKEYSPELITSLSFFVGLAFVTPFALYESTGGLGQEFIITNISIKTWAGILYMALLSSITAYYAFQKALKHAHMADIALIGYLQPIMAVPIAYIVLQETPTILELIAAGLIGLGVWIAEKSKT